MRAGRLKSRDWGQDSSRGSSQKSGQGGTTLLETLVAAAVLMVVLSLAADLLAESARRLRFEVDRTREPIGQAIARLEADIRLSGSARVAADPDGPWRMLRLDDHPAGRVEWRLSLGTLRRRVIHHGRSGEATVLERVQGFEVSALHGGGLVVVDLQVLRRSRRAGPTHLPFERLEMETVRAVAAPRGDSFP